MLKGRKKIIKVVLKYSLLNDTFLSKIGKRLAIGLKDSISNWSRDKNQKNANELIQLFIQTLSTYWKKTKLEDFKEYELTNDFDLIVDLIYKKGRKPNTIQLKNNPAQKEALLELYKAK